MGRLNPQAIATANAAIAALRVEINEENRKAESPRQRVLAKRIAKLKESRISKLQDKIKVLEGGNFQKNVDAHQALKMKNRRKYAPNAIKSDNPKKGKLKS